MSVFKQPNRPRAQLDHSHIWSFVFCSTNLQVFAQVQLRLPFCSDMMSRRCVIGWCPTFREKVVASKVRQTVNRCGRCLIPNRFTVTFASFQHRLRLKRHVLRRKWTTSLYPYCFKQYLRFFTSKLNVFFCTYQCSFRRNFTEYTLIFYIQTFLHLPHFLYSPFLSPTMCMIHYNPTPYSFLRLRYIKTIKINYLKN